MPGVVSFDKMAVGRAGGGKHWTQDQVERRHQAAQTVRRKKHKPPRPPDWVKGDIELYAIWRQTVNDAKEIELFDALDANALATYCKLQAEMQHAAVAGDVETFERLSKTGLQYAKTLGLTPEARARLAKKRADGNEGGDPNAALFE